MFLVSQHKGTDESITLRSGHIISKWHVGRVRVVVADIGRLLGTVA
jgi:hypothetical protein